MKKAKLVLTIFAMPFIANFTFAEHAHLHINPRWKECSFQIDPSLTQQEWHQFAREGGMAIYFRSLMDAKPMGPGRYEFSLLQWNTKIDENKGAWNNTFVHPDSIHWLIGGDELPFPGLSFRAGITRKLDAGIYWTVRPGANYGFIGGQIQYNLVNDTAKHWSAAARINMNTIYGPHDLNLAVVGLDVLASKDFKIHSDWLFIAPYAGLSSYLTHAHEKTEVVTLKDENISGIQCMAGAVAKISIARIGVEYNFANINTFSYKLGVNFKF